jgi:hypothetical protein
MDIYDYAKLGQAAKVKLLVQKARIIELYNEKEITRQVYSLNDFFVEVTISEGKIVDYIPFQRGFKTSGKLFGSS